KAAKRVKKLKFECPYGFFFNLRGYPNIPARTRRAATSRSPFFFVGAVLRPFFGEAKKVSSRRATPGKVKRSGTYLFRKARNEQKRTDTDKETKCTTPTTTKNSSAP
ncbi:MAG: hypothetical protein P4L91_14330, partial [Burkholderiaceae bacterium]|nr:hypothetical protein [Burkholderiaceae bacterium]